MSINSFITNSENLDEKLSVVEFIKTLKKIDSVEMVNGNNNERNSETNSSTGSVDKVVGKTSEDFISKQKKPMEKKASATELLTNMRKRFQHRATEPIFHTLATTQETSLEQQSSSGGGSDNALKMPQMTTLLNERMADSEPVMINQLHNKCYHKYLRKD